MLSGIKSRSRSSTCFLICLGILASHPRATLALPTKPSGDFLALSDVANATFDFNVDKSEYLVPCAGGECGEAIQVFSVLAKRLLSDPRILGLSGPRLVRSALLRSDTAEHQLETNSSELLPVASALASSHRNDRYDTYYGDHRYDVDVDGDQLSSSSSYRDRDRLRDHERDRDRGGYTQTAGYGSPYEEPDEPTYSLDRRPSGQRYVNYYQPDNDRDDSYGGGGGYGGGGYDGGGGYEGGGGYGGGDCCKSKYLPILIVGLLGLLAFFLYLRTTTTAGRRGFGLKDIADPSDGTSKNINKKHKKKTT